MWSHLINYINETGNFNQAIECIKELLKLSHYKKYSTFDQLIQHSVTLFKLSNLKLKPDSCYDLMEINEINNDLTYRGPYLINIMKKLLLRNNGELRQISIKELPQWQKQLNQINELLWFNSSLLDSSNTIIDNFKFVLSCAKKLLLEIEFIFERVEKLNSTKFNNKNDKDINFMDLIKKLNTEINENSNLDYKFYDINKLEQKISFIYSLMGFIQLHLITFTPLVDPIEKNRFKKQYIDEDINCLNSLSNAYNIASIAMDYKNLAGEYRTEINKKLENLSNKRQKFVQINLEKRPESHLYSKMIQDITHYLYSNCKINQLLSIYEKILNCFTSINNNKLELQQEISECIKIIKVWILNSQQFLQQIIKKYPSYHEDILQPIECALVMTRYGFENLKNKLIQLKGSLTFEIEHNNLERNDLNQILQDLIEYPNFEILPKIIQNKLFNILEKLDYEQYEILQIKLLKTKVSEIETVADISLEINTKLFTEFDNTLAHLSKIWENQENQKKLQQIEEESLYVMKTRCQNENEEEDDLNAMRELFPTTVTEDFSEFLEINSLENQPNVNKSKVNEKNSIINEYEFKFVAENFIKILETYSQTSYTLSSSQSKLKPLSSLKFNNLFNDKLQIFQTIFDIYKPALNELFDLKMYNTFSLIIKFHQNQMNNTDKNNFYNIYKDSNIPEISSCVPLIDEIEKRTQQQLNLYHDNAILLDILKVTNRIGNFATTSPVVRFNVGFQLLRQKLSMWNDVAHKNNHMQDLEIRAAEFVQRWTKLELKFWRNCLIDAKEKVETTAYKYWFFMYNLITEFLTNDANIGNLENSEIKLNDIIKVLKQFLESSNYGDFSIRIKLIKSFELYLNLLMQHQDNENKTKEKLIIAIYNIRLYYEQFSNEIDEIKKQLLASSEKKLKELIKIESFNKDLSYFSMKNNIDRVHRNLNKFVKEYSNGLKESITKVFEYKDGNLYDLNSIHDKGGKNLRNDPKIKCYMTGAKDFIASDKFKRSIYDLNNDDTFSNSTQNSSALSLNRLEKLFLTSRNVCKKIISNIEYPNLTSNLESVLSNYFETYEYLHNLSVDRTQEKPKQIAQNKNFLQQKRKALADVFKTLTILGVNYRTGLMEITINSEYINFKIKPFSIDNLLLNNITKSKTLNQNFIYLNDNLNLYYTKCAYKMKILQNNLLNPNAELGPPNIDRIKGFSVDMFLLVQNQRKLLSSSVNKISKLRKNMMNLIKLTKCCQINNYDESKLNFIQLENELLCLKDIFNKIYTFIIQFKLLLETIPVECNQDSSVFENLNETFTKNSDKYEKILQKCDKILQTSKESIMEMKNLSTLEPLDYEIIKKLSDNKIDCINLIKDLYSEFNSSNSHISIADSLHKLLNRITEVTNKYEEIEHPIIDVDVNTINNEIENIVHTSLIAMQNLFKKYNIDEEITAEQQKNKLNIIGASEIYDNHLKEKIYKEISIDFLILNINKICSKIENVYLAIKHLNYKSDIIRKLSVIIPILHQYNLLAYYYIFQQLGAHKVSVKMLYVMLSAFIELSSKGFCSPADLIQDEDGQEQQQNSKSEGGGFSEDNTVGNEKDVSDQIENEDQLDDAKKPEDRKNDKNENDKDCKEEKGIDMSENFDADLQDVEKDDDKDEKNTSEDEDDLDKEMGDTEQGADKLDDQIWGSDNEEEENNSQDENEMSDDEYSKGCKDEKDSHNDLDSKNDKSTKENELDENNEDLDAVDDEQDNRNEKKQKEKDIDNMKEPELDEEQTNPYHNELEEPPEAEDMQLDDNMNMEEDGDKEQRNDLENPFDIDKMKETMELDEETPENDDADEQKNDSNASDDNDSDSDDENYDNLKQDKDNLENDDNDDDDNHEEENKKDENNEDETNNAQKNNDDENIIEKQEKNDEKINEKYDESKDKSSKEENVQSNEADEVKGSNDQVDNAENKNVQQEQKLDDQETGEDSKGVGQADDEKADTGHQSVSDTKEIDSVEKNTKEKNSKMKNKPQKTDENRALGEHNEDTLKNLKTIDKNDNKKLDQEEQNEQNKEKDLKAEEYQHVKDPEKSKITAIDNATEEQSKQIKHLNDEEENSENDEEMDVDQDLNGSDLDEDQNELEDDTPELKSEKNKQKSDKANKLNEINDDKQTNEEKMEIEGENVETLLPLRSSDTTAHCLKENLFTNSVEDPTDMETLELRKMYYKQLESAKKVLPQAKDHETWQTISTLMQSNARELCEQLRLILEPTKCTKLKGDYKTGRRINMKKIIPYIASQFRKDKIWLRRTKPSQRDYKITIAIDDSKSMHHNNSKEITLKAISLVSQALTLLESGKLNILSFGETPQIILNHIEQFDGPKLVNSLNFDQNQSRIAELLDFIRTLNVEEYNSTTDNRLFENLLLILSDGRNIYGEGEQKVKNSVKLAKLQRIFIVYVIIDNPENKHSILDIRVPNFSSDRKTISMRSYLDTFPFPYYVIVRDLDQLPLVLSEAMRQWFELVNSEQ